MLANIAFCLTISILNFRLFAGPKLDFLAGLIKMRHAANEFFKIHAPNTHTASVGSIWRVSEIYYKLRTLSDWHIAAALAVSSGKSTPRRSALISGHASWVRHRRTHLPTDPGLRRNWAGKLHISSYFYAALNGERESGGQSCLRSAMK